MSMTIFCDIDATLIKGYTLKQIYSTIDEEYADNYNDDIVDTQVLNSVHRFVEKVISSGGKLILTTARPKILRYETEQQLKKCRICYHGLIMDCPSPRYVINNKSDDGKERARGFNVETDEGLERVYKEIFKE